MQTPMVRLLTAVMSIGDIVKDEVNPYYKSKYLTLPKLLGVVRPQLAANALTLHSRLTVESESRTVLVRTSVFDAFSGEELLFSEFPVVEMAMQKVGAACTYGTRQNIMQLLCISAIDEDDDGNAIAPQVVAQSETPFWGQQPPGPAIESRPVNTHLVNPFI